MVVARAYVDISCKPNRHGSLRRTWFWVTLRRPICSSNVVSYPPAQYTEGSPWSLRSLMQEALQSLHWVALLHPFMYSPLWVGSPGSTDVMLWEGFHRSPLTLQNRKGASRLYVGLTWKHAAFGIAETLLGFNKRLWPSPNPVI